ncbi:hypothetical protein [Nocardia sp. NPDC024068]|uniref:hypothetical protein n=1 Tax=Nocardia sp. NPDC024068 TaxID=3157197 RepID=UPI003405F1C5
MCTVLLAAGTTAAAGAGVPAHAEPDCGASLQSYSGGLPLSVGYPGDDRDYPSPEAFRLLPNRMAAFPVVLAARGVRTQGYRGTWNIDSSTAELTVKMTVDGDSRMLANAATLTVRPTRCSGRLVEELGGTVTWGSGRSATVTALNPPSPESFF